MLGIAKKSSTSLLTQAGTIASIENSTIEYTFDDDGGLIDIFMDFGVHIGKPEQAVYAYKTIHEALSDKYGKPSAIEDDAWYVIYGSAVSKYESQSAFIKSLGITPSLQEKAQWILRYDDINVKIDLIRYAPNGGTSSDVIVSYRFFTDEEEQQAIDRLDSQQKYIQDDL